SAREALRDTGYNNVSVIHGDGTMGWKPNAPYQGIVVAAGAPEVPLPLVAQLTHGGRLVVPVGDRDSQVLTLVTRHAVGEGFDTTPVDDVRFVPLLGQFGWAPPES